MNMNDEQYERIGRWLDGETIELTAEERAVALEIRRDESAMADAMLDVQVPLPAMARARKRMTVALVGQGRRVLRIGFGAVGAAAAAAVVLAVSMLWTEPQAARPRQASSEIPADVWIGAMTPSPQIEAINALGDAIDRLAADVVVSKPLIDRGIESMQDELLDPWQEDAQSWSSDG